MKRSRLVLVVILIGPAVLVTALWVNEGPLWRLIMTKRVHFEGHPLNGWYTVKRWTQPPLKHGPKVLYFVETGLLRAKLVFRDGKCFQTTFWLFDGKVDMQLRFEDGTDQTLEIKNVPPWWCGEKAQVPLERNNAR